MPWLDSLPENDLDLVGVLLLHQWKDRVVHGIELLLAELELLEYVAIRKPRHVQGKHSPDLLNPGQKRFYQTLWKLSLLTKFQRVQSCWLCIGHKLLTSVLGCKSHCLISFSSVLLFLLRCRVDGDCQRDGDIDDTRNTLRHVRLTSLPALNADLARTPNACSRRVFRLHLMDISRKPCRLDELLKHLVYSAIDIGMISWPS